MNVAGQRILLAGAPRSGTTWVANVLASAPAATVAVEPDNEKTSLLAVAWKDGLPRFPVLPVGTENPGYRRLWRYAFDGRLGPFLSRSWLTRASLLGGRWAESKIAARPVVAPELDAVDAPPPDRADAPSVPQRDGIRIVKTVHAVLCLDWVCANAAPHRVVVVGRHPLAVIDSWRRLDMPDGERLWTAARDWLAARDRLPPDLDDASPLVRRALQAGLMYRALDDFCERRPAVLRISHEALCRDPAAEFASLFERLGLAWTDEAEQALAQSNREGRGYRPVRVAEREIGKWQGRFGATELNQVTAILAAFGVAVPSVG
jgi:hypothetical protein